MTPRKELRCSCGSGVILYRHDPKDRINCPDCGRVLHESTRKSEAMKKLLEKVNRGSGTDRHDGIVKR